MSGFNYKRLAVAAGLVVAASVASGGQPATACSAASVASSTNDNGGDVFERNDAKAVAISDTECHVAEDILRNVHDTLNQNFRHNLSDNFTDNVNRSFNHNNNDNVRHLFSGSEVEFSWR
jgi:hypothetical protein